MYLCIHICDNCTTLRDALYSYTIHFLLCRSQSVVGFCMDKLKEQLLIVDSILLIGKMSIWVKRKKEKF